MPPNVAKCPEGVIVRLIVYPCLKGTQYLVQTQVGPLTCGVLTYWGHINGIIQALTTDKPQTNYAMYCFVGCFTRLLFSINIIALEKFGSCVAMPVGDQVLVLHERD